MSCINRAMHCNYEQRVKGVSYTHHKSGKDDYWGGMRELLQLMFYDTCIYEVRLSMCMTCYMCNCTACSSSSSSSSSGSIIR